MKEGNGVGALENVFTSIINKLLSIDMKLADKDKVVMLHRAQILVSQQIAIKYFYILNIFFNLTFLSL